MMAQQTSFTESLSDRLTALRAELWQFVAADPDDENDEMATDALEPLAEIISSLGSRLYVVTVGGCVDPALHGPFTSSDERYTKARDLYNSDEYSEDYDAIFALDVAADGTASVSCFAGDDLVREVAE